jgi:hypothetical protein
MEWSPATFGQMSSWGKIFWSMWKQLFIPEVMVLSGLVDDMSQLAGPLKKLLKEQPLEY